MAALQRQISRLEAELTEAKRAKAAAPPAAPSTKAAVEKPTPEPEKPKVAEKPKPETKKPEPEKPDPAKLAATAYPALEPADRGANIKLFPSEEQARESHRKGVRALFFLRFEKDL